MSNLDDTIEKLQFDFKIEREKGEQLKKELEKLKEEYNMNEQNSETNKEEKKKEIKTKEEEKKEEIKTNEGDKEEEIKTNEVDNNNMKNRMQLEEVEVKKKEWNLIEDNGIKEKKKFMEENKDLKNEIEILKDHLEVLNKKNIIIGYHKIESNNLEKYIIIINYNNKNKILLSEVYLDYKQLNYP